MRFLNLTNSELINEATQRAEQLLEVGSKMYHDVFWKNDWRYDSGGGQDIAKKLVSPDEKQTIVGLYTPGYAGTKAIGRFNMGQIEISGYALSWLKLEDVVGLLLHERAHQKGFHHIDPGWLGRKLANYKTKNKCLYSVPYYLSENVSKWL